MEIYIRLREERKRLGMSQTQFANAIGIVLTTQSNYETGLRKPDSEYLAKAAALGVDVLYLLTGQRIPKESSALSVRESCLIDNYRAAAEEARRAIEATSSAFAKSQVDNKDKSA